MHFPSLKLHYQKFYVIFSYFELEKYTYNLKYSKFIPIEMIYNHRPGKQQKNVNFPLLFLRVYVSLRDSLAADLIFPFYCTFKRGQSENTGV